MKFKRCARAVSSRVPFFTLSVALLCILAVGPLTLSASADGVQSGDDVQSGSSAPTGATGALTLQDAAAQQAAAPRLTGRLTDRHDTGSDAIRVRGSLHNAGTGTNRVSLSIRRPGRRGWRSVAAVRAKAGSKFKIVWRAKTPGRFLTRISVTVAGRALTDRLGAAYVYRRSFASWYGPGFYGNRTACGGRLTASVVGVAHKSLPCGTRVTFRLRGRTVTARVIDRGPYAHGRTWDLTPALKRKLRFGSTGSVNATS
ncbi:MAG: septal ring lytic transglycosylase RlpA family protein [Solirubrobacterales bacterium]